MDKESMNENENVEILEMPPTASSVLSVRRERTKTSDIWNHFIIVDDGGKKDRAKCIHCGRILACDTLKNGTSSLKKHIRICAKLLTNIDVKQKTLSFPTLNNKGQQISSFSVDTCRELLANMIINEELPLKFVERKSFRAYSECLNSKFFVPSRFTVARDILTLYEKEKMKFKEYFKSTSQRVSLTTDTWTSIQNVNYMVLTCHYIDSDWTLQKKILNFCLIEDHKGETIGSQIEKCLFEWGIENVLTVTVDNASSNDVVISYLIKSVQNWNGLVLNGECMHMRCFAHILNLIVTDGLKDHEEAICRVRRAIKYVRSSPARSKHFKNCADNVKIACKSSVCLDVSTRWNSTYLMLASTEKFEKAFDKLRETDSNYFGYLNGKTSPTKSDWTNIRELVKFLKVFYDITVTVSASSHVTSNIYFSEVCSLKMVIMENAQSDNPSLKKMAFAMQGKFNKYWENVENINFLMYVALVLDLRCKMEFLQHLLSMVVDDNKVTDLVSQVRRMIDNLYPQYKTDLGFEMLQDHCRTSVGASSSSGQSSHNKLFANFRNRGRDASNKKTEVNQYLSEDVLENFSNNQDILAWWKFNSLKYPTLSKIAKDVLAIPISTVPSESAFSNGGRVLDCFRSCLSPKTVEALICCQNCLNGEKHDLENFSDAVEFDKETDDSSTLIKISE